MKESQLPKRFRDIIDEESTIFSSKTTTQLRATIPATTDIPITDPNHWIKIPDVICVFVDMRNSTGLSANAHSNTTAASYRYFTSTAVKFFHEVDAPYIDIKGDGVFAIFDSHQSHTALAAAVSFRSFAVSEFVPKVKSKTAVDVGVRVGIDTKTVLVRKLGLKVFKDRSDRQNEVWAGKPVNMASKLSSYANNNEIIVSNRFYKNLKDDKALLSCGCSGGTSGNPRQDLWKSIDISQDKRLDFDVAFSLSSDWCEIHGTEYCQHLLGIDKV